MIMILEGCLWAFRFMVGACIFSFLNVVIYRLPLGESVMHGRSHCPCCGRTLTAGELIPCFSYLIQRGKCRGCGLPISERYILIECLGGAAFVFCSAFFGYGISGVISFKGLAAFLYLAILTVVAWIDWDTRIILDRFHIGILVLGLISIPLYPELMLMERLVGMVVVALPMFWIALLVDGAFGGGDIKLMASSGFLLGWRATIFAMFIGLVTGGVYCIFMLAIGRLGRKDRFAFGPFLSVGLGIGYFYGDTVMRWYLSTCGLQ